MLNRPSSFRIDYNHSLAKGLVFAGLGGGRGSLKYLDSSPYGNHGTLTNMDPPTDWVWVPELGRWALDFDGTDTVVITGGSSRFIHPEYSVVVWTSCTSVADRRGVVGRGKWDTGNGWYIDYYNGGNLDFVFDAKDKKYLRYTSSPGVAGWLSLACRHRSGQQSVAINGVGVAAATQAGAPDAGVTNLFLGQSTDDTTKYPYVGYIADAMYFSRYLSDDEVKALADPSNVMLSGLILPPKRKYYGIISTIPIVSNLSQRIFKSKMFSSFIK